ncbi:beta-lactamase family protein [Nonomuraea sp. NBC_01738]|uniref:serine hydrolase domain-containing protein n=1 Tax=Nonomuraea sp. NBC_01738 TaxID=2976003 RepID=UPI002E0D6EBD|nr:beta-lactamase family protein [Nonomuraea sp. NBC_01738]
MNSIQEAVDKLVESGEELGLQVAVYRHGELVADVVAGEAAPGRPVTSDTPFFSYSTGKGVTATVIHVLAERGVLDYDRPIAELWPEFAAEGKGATTLRHVLTHSAGLPAVPAGTTPESLCDWEGMCAALAAATPWWEPGTRTGYHAMTFGYLAGEVVRRATGKPISRVLREEIAQPLGIERELYFGVPDDQAHRVAELRQAPMPDMPMDLPDLPMFTATPAAVMPSAAYGNRPDVLAADIPSGSTLSARGVARMYAALLDGTLVSGERLREISRTHVTGQDQMTYGPAAWALGYAVGVGGTPSSFGMQGVGGSGAFADPETGLAFALTLNRFNMADAKAFDLVKNLL